MRTHTHRPALVTQVEPNEAQRAPRSSSEVMGQPRRWLKRGALPSQAAPTDVGGYPGRPKVRLASIDDGVSWPVRPHRRRRLTLSQCHPVPPYRRLRLGRCPRSPLHPLGLRTEKALASPHLPLPRSPRELLLSTHCRQPRVAVSRHHPGPATSVAGQSFSSTQLHSRSASSRPFEH